MDDYSMDDLPMDEHMMDFEMDLAAEELLLAAHETPSSVQRNSLPNPLHPPHSLYFSCRTQTHSSMDSQHRQSCAQES